MHQIVYTSLDMQKDREHYRAGGENWILNNNIIQIEKVPETIDAERWAKFNAKINDLANQGFTISFVEDRFIVLNRVKHVVRREE